MKKILVSMLAVAAMVACSNEDTLQQAELNAPIVLDSFVGNSTRANDVDNSSIKNFGFGVYASVTNGNGASGLILENEAVTYTNAWGYENTQYWVPGNTYNFTAIAPTVGAKWAYTPANGTAHNGVIAFDNRAAEANQDLVFAYANRVVESAYTATPEAVKFTFDHMLSRVRFSFANAWSSAGNIELKVENVCITDAYANGTLEVNGGVPAAAWTPAEKTLDVEFGGAAETIIEGAKQSTEHFYLIPNSESTRYTVTFDVKLYQAGVLIDTYSHTVEFACAMQRGYSYDIKTTLTPENTSDDGAIYPIVFDVTAVKDWANYAEVETEALVVATAEDLAAAVVDGGNVRLANNLTLANNELVVAKGKEVKVDLNGFTLTVASLDPIKNNGKMTIANGKVVAGNDVNTRRCIYNYGEMVIENMEFVQTYGAKGAAINNEGTMTIKSATVNSVYYAIWNSGANAMLTIEDGTFNCVGDNDSWKPSNDSVAWCYAVTNRDGAKMVVNGGTFTGNHGVIAAYDNAEVTLNAGTFNCYATMTGNSDWVLYAYDAVISYNAAECVLIHAVKPANACCTTEENGTVVAF